MKIDTHFDCLPDCSLDEGGKTGSVERCNCPRRKSGEKRDPTKRSLLFRHDCVDDRLHGRQRRRVLEEFVLSEVRYRPVHKGDSTHPQELFSCWTAIGVDCQARVKVVLHDVRELVHVFDLRCARRGDEVQSPQRILVEIRWFTFEHFLDGQCAIAGRMARETHQLP